MADSRFVCNLFMFVRQKAEVHDRGAHFANAAKRFALDAKMFRCRAAVHVENKDDIFFWSSILKHFRPNDRFHFIAGSRNEYGHETNGVTQCLKYADYLNNDFFICIDSDYRYLMRERKINVKHYILQTYTYSFENHHCFADGLDDVCARVTHSRNDVFNFRRFLKEYSNIIYELFIWHLYFLNSDPGYFTKYEFSSYLNLVANKPHPLIYDNASRALDELRIRVERKTAYLGRKFPHADLAFVRKKYEELGLSSDTAYLFVRGHNLYDMIHCLCREVCKAILRRKKHNREVNREMVAELYRNRYNIEVELKRNIKYGAYLHIRKIEQDIRKFFGEN